MRARRSYLILPLLAVALCACGDEDRSWANATAVSFPARFLWGTAIAGFQADMGCPTLSAAQCDDVNSDWYAFVTSPVTRDAPDTFVSGDPVSSGPGFWELYAQDLDRAAQQLHNNAFRLSLEWSRIFPTATDAAEGYDALRAIANPDALARYHQILATARARGLTPLVTLNHYTLPTWLHDAIACHRNIRACTARGWLDRERAVREISKFAGFCGREFGADVDLWATLNEPLAPILAGYVFPSETRSQPPAVYFRFKEAKAALAAMIEAHARMYDALKAADTIDADHDGTAAQVGVVFALAPFRPKDPSNPLDVKGAESLQYLYNETFLNATVNGDVDTELDGNVVHRADFAGRMDYIGVNYYQRYAVVGLESALFPVFSPLLTADPGSLGNVEDFPHGLYEVLMFVKQKYDLPMYVTENGTVQDTGDPTGYLVHHVTWVSRARRDGADVRGYFVWTLMDNYEWNHGMGAIRLGMYAVDKNDPDKTRVMRPSASVYGRIASANQVPVDLTDAYPEPE